MMALEIHDVNLGPTIYWPYQVRGFYDVFRIDIRSKIYAWLDERNIQHIVSSFGVLCFRRPEDRTMFLLRFSGSG